MGENRTPAASMTLDDQLCFALYSASRAVTAALSARVDPKADPGQ
ncbi:hypothetical protein [Streptomyces sp. NPDC055749]